MKVHNVDDCSTFASHASYRHAGAEPRPPMRDHGTIHGFPPFLVITIAQWTAHSRRKIAVAGIAFLIAMIGVASCILGGLYLLFRDDHPSDEAKKRRKRLLVSNWK